jgi:hypothetical protein
MLITILAIASARVKAWEEAWTKTVFGYETNMKQESK